MTYIPQSEEERKFLESYDPNKWPKPSLTADIAVFAADGDKLYLLLVERGGFPYKGFYALPGGFANMDEDIIDTARRELEEETGLAGMTLTQCGMYGKPGRDPRSRTVTALHMALVDKNKVKPKAGDDARKAEWFLIEKAYESVIKNDDLSERKLFMELVHGETKLEINYKKTVSYGETREEHIEFSDSGIAFDHALCIAEAYLQLKDKIKTTDIGYDVLGKHPKEENVKLLFKAVLR